MVRPSTIKIESVSSETAQRTLRPTAALGWSALGVPAWGSELLVGHRLRLDLGDSRDLLECLKEVRLGRMARLLPWAEGVERHSGEELEVEASTADGAGDDSALELLELGQILVHDIRNLNQRLGAVLAAAIVLPLAPASTDAHMPPSYVR